MVIVGLISGDTLHFKRLTFPTGLREVDWVVSLAKMKTHHWTGISLSMKNLFGVMGHFTGGPTRFFPWQRLDPINLINSQS